MKRSLAITLAVVLTLIILPGIDCTVYADSTTVSSAPNADNITVTNNAAGTKDVIELTGLQPLDVVKVYTIASGGTALATKTVGSSSTDITISVSQIGAVAGSAYISIKSTNCLESSRAEVKYDAEPVSGAPLASDITVTNNAKGTSDTVCVSGLNAKDIIKVYNASSGGKLLAKKTVSSSGSDTTVTISQLGTTASSAYVSVTSTACTESTRIQVDYDAEPTSDTIDTTNVTITNNPTGTSDTVYVSGLSAKDIVKVYNASSGGKLLGSKTVASSGSDATVKISKLSTTGGSVFISLKSTGCLESSRVEVLYEEELDSDDPDAEDITVTNNAKGTYDTVYVRNLSVDDVVKVYNKATNGSLLKKATTSYSDLTISISQLGANAGSVYVSVTSAGMNESGRVQASYIAESTSTAPSESNILATNKPAGTSDTVYVKGLSVDDIVKVYDAATSGSLLGKATSSSTNATVTISQLGTEAANVYVTVTSTGKKESSRTEVAYSAESASNAPDASKMIIKNNAAGTSDAIYVCELQEADIIKVYKTAKGGTAIGTATVESGSSYAFIYITQLGTSAGSVYITVTSTDKLESSCTELSYEPETQAETLTTSSISVTNNKGSVDTVKVTGLASGDIIKIYNAASGGTVLGIATVSTYDSSVNISIDQLGTVAGKIYVTLTSVNENESKRTEVSYVGETKSDAPSIDNITVVNNYLSASTVEVTGLEEDDIVNIYDAETAGTLLGTDTVDKYNTEVTVSISQLSASGGTVYVTVTGTGESESARTAVTYSAKSTSTAPTVSYITIKNNADVSDTITVKNITTGTVIKVYSASANGDLLGTATSTGTNVTVTIDQLGIEAGKVYISATSTGKIESSRTEVAYLAEAASNAILAGNVTIANNSGLSDTITITGLVNGDTVKVYNVSSGGTAIASTTVSGTSLTTKLTVLQLGTTSGSVYISVTSTGDTESGRTKVDYAAESTAPLASNITVVNNAGISDTITVAGLTSGDVVNVYNAASSGTLLGTATVTTSSTSITVSVSQLSSSAGYAYIGVTNSGCAESSLTKVVYTAEETTKAPDEGDISIANNSGINDTITVYELIAGDVIRVYDASSDGDLLGRATVSSGSTQAIVSIDELGTSAGSVYVTVKTKGKLESSTTEASYSSESKSTVPYVGNITIVNNVSIADTVTVTGLDASDVVKVYNASSSGTLLGYATVNFRFQGNNFHFTAWYRCRYTLYLSYANRED